MAKQQDPLRSIYNDLGLEKSGIGYDKFSSKFMSDSNARRSVYTDLGLEQAGIDYNTFESRLGVKKKEDSGQDSASGAQTSTQPLRNFQAPDVPEITSSYGSNIVLDKPFEGKGMEGYLEEEGGLEVEMPIQSTYGRNLLEPKTFGDMASRATPQPTQVSPEKQSKWADFVDSVERGSVSVGTMLAGLPEFLYEQTGLGDYEQAIAALGPMSGLTALNQVKDFYAARDQELSNRITQYEDDMVDSALKGNFIDAGAQLFNAIGESIAPMLLMATTGSIGAGGSGALSYAGSALPQSAGRLIAQEAIRDAPKVAATAIPFASSKWQEIKDDPNIPAGLKPLVAYGSGLSEIIYEGSFGTAKLMRQVANKAIGKKGINRIVKGFFDKALESNGIPASAFKGSVSEMSTQLTNNLIDIYSGIDPDRDPYQGLANAGVVGAVMDAGISTPTHISGMIANRAEAKEALSLSEANEGILGDLMNPELNFTPEQRKELIDRYDKNTEKIDAYVRNSAVQQSKLTPRQRELQQSLLNRRKVLDEIINNEALSEATRQESEAELSEVDKQIDAISPKKKEAHEIDIENLPDDVREQIDEKNIRIQNINIEKKRLEEQGITQSDYIGQLNEEERSLYEEINQLAQSERTETPTDETTTETVEETPTEPVEATDTATKEVVETPVEEPARSGQTNLQGQPTTDPSQAVQVVDESEAETGQYFTRDIGGEQTVYRRNEDGTASIVPDTEAQNILSQQDVTPAESTAEQTTIEPTVEPVAETTTEQVQEAVPETEPVAEKRPMSSFSNYGEYIQYVSETETDPDVVANEYNNIPSGEPDVIEQGIMDYLGDGRINKRDLQRYGDLNQYDKGLLSRWSDSKNNQLDLDQMAQELSEQLGVEVSPSEFIDFTLKYKGKHDFSANQKTREQSLLEGRYKELTGRILTPEIAERARERMAENITDEQLAASNVGLQELGITYQDILNYEEYNRQTDGSAESVLPANNEGRRTETSGENQTPQNKQKTVEQLQPEAPTEPAATQPAAKAGDNLRSLADKIRQAKISKPDDLRNLRSSTLFDVAWDGALETAATALEATGNIADAVEAGVNHLKQTEWYKSLSEGGKKKAETTVRATITGEQPEKRTPQGKRVSGIKKSLVDQSIIDSTEVERIPRDKMMEYGERFVKSGEVKPRDIITEIVGYKPNLDFNSDGSAPVQGLLGGDKPTKGKPRALQPKEVVGLIWYKAELDNEYTDALTRYDEMRDAGEDLSVITKRLAELRQEREDYQVMSIITAQQQSLAFSLRQGLLDENYNIVSFIAEYKNINKGYISPEKEAEFRKMAEELDKLREDLKKLQAEQDARDAEQAVQAIKDDVAKDSELKPSARAKAQKAVRALEDIQKKLRSKTYDATIGVPVAIIDAGITVTKKAIMAGATIIDAVEAGIAHIRENHGKKWKEDEFRKDMIEEFKKRGVADESGPYRDVNGMLVVPDEYIRYVASTGNENISDMVAAVRNDLDGIDASDREIRDAITKYGRKVGQTRSEISTAIGKARRAGKLLSQIEDVIAGKSKAMTGKKMAELNTEENDLKHTLRLLEDNMYFTTEEQAIYEKLNNEERQAYLDNYIAEMRDKIKNKSFSTRKPRQWNKTPETLKKERDAAMIREKFEAEKYKAELENRKFGEILIDRAGEFAINLGRMLMAGADFAATGVQGAATLFTRPVYAWRGFKESVTKSWTQKQTDEYFAAIQSKPRYDQARLSGLAMQHPNLRVEARDAAMKGNVTDILWNTLMLPLKYTGQLFGRGDKWYDIAKQANPLNIGQRAYDLTVTQMRLDWFEELASALERDGKTFMTDPREYQRAANLANLLTFRSGLGKAETIAKEMAVVYFAPRKVVATLTLASPYFWAHLGYSNKTLFKKGAGAMLQFMGSVALAVGVLNALQDDEDENKNIWNPYHPDFLKLRIGNTRIDFTGGMAPTIVFLARFFSGNYQTTSSPVRKKLGEDYGAPTKWGLMQAYNEGKFNPNISLLAKKLGERKGRKEDWEKLLEESGQPMWTTAIREFLKEHETLPALGLSVLTPIGLNSNTYGGAEFLDPKSKEDEKYRRLFNIKGMSVYTPTRPNVEIYDIKEGKKRVLDKKEYGKYKEAYDKYMNEEIKTNYQAYKEAPVESFEKMVNSAKRKAKEYALSSVSGITDKDMQIKSGDKTFKLTPEQVSSRKELMDQYIKENRDILPDIRDKFMDEGMSKEMADMEAQKELASKARSYSRQVMLEQNEYGEIELTEGLED